MPDQSQIQATSLRASEETGAATNVRRSRWTTGRILVQTWKAISGDNISLLAAGVAFYSLLAVFPGLAFLVAMFGLLADPNQVQQQLSQVRDVLPKEAWDAINAQLSSLAQQSGTKLSVASIVSLTLAFVNARLAAYSMMGALNVIYKRPETRSFLKINAIAFMFTIAAIAILAFNVVAVVSVPEFLQKMGFLELSHVIIDQIRWPALAFLMAFGLALTYRFGPDRKEVQWHWMTLGSLVATALWLIGTSAFSWYVSAFNSYDRLYGSFGAVVILLYWFWLTAFAALMGAELDMQIQTELKENP